MQSVWICILASRPFEDTFDTQWRIVNQMQPMWLYIILGRQLEDTFENTRWRKVKQMQPVQFCIISGRELEDTFKNTLWRKVWQKYPPWQHFVGVSLHYMKCDLNLTTNCSCMFVFVTMPSCAICRFEAPSDKHLRMHIETKHDDRVLTCEKCENTCKGGRRLKTHIWSLTGKLPTTTVRKRFHTIVGTVTWRSVLVIKISSTVKTALHSR